MHQSHLWSAGRSLVSLCQSPQVLRQYFSELIEDPDNDIAGMLRLVQQKGQEH